MRELHKERLAYREIADERSGAKQSASRGHGAARIFAPQGMDPAVIEILRAKPLDTTNQKPLQPSPPALPALRYYVPGLDLAPSSIHPPKP